MKYTGIYKCGHEGTINIYGPSKDRNQKAEWVFSKLCPECSRQRHMEIVGKEIDSAKQAATEMELPELQGTERQVAWAVVLRQDFINKVSASIEESKKHPAMSVEELHQKAPETALFNGDLIDLAYAVLDFALSNKTDASYWIDTRNSFSAALNTLRKEYLESISEETDPIQSIDEEIKQNTVVSPEKPAFPGFVEIKGDDNEIQLIYEKNNDFIKIVKDHHFKWNGAVWTRTLGETTGKFCDRAAEIGNALLLSGFSVGILDDGIRQNAIDGVFKKECFLWVLWNETHGKLAISWPRSSNFYEEAHRLPSAQWKNPYMLVEISHHKEVEDFASIHGFQISESAKKEIAKYQGKIDDALKVFPSIPAPKKSTDKLKEILKSSEAIISDLKDE